MNSEHMYHISFLLLAASSRHVFCTMSPLSLPCIDFMLRNANSWILFCLRQIVVPLDIHLSFFLEHNGYYDTNGLVGLVGAS